MGKWCMKESLKQLRNLTPNIVLEWEGMEVFIKLSYSQVKLLLLKNSTQYRIMGLPMQRLLKMRFVLY